MNTIRTRTRRGAAILFSGILVLGGLALTGEASAQQDVDNPSCADLGYDFGQRWEDPSGTYAIDRDGMIANFTVGTYPDVTEPNPNNAITDADIVTDADGYAVIVKAANGYNLYPDTERRRCTHRRTRAASGRRSATSISAGTSRHPSPNSGNSR